MALISPSKVAKNYGITAAQLRQWRKQGIGPEYFQFTARTVSYADDYLADWFNDPDNAHLIPDTVRTGPSRGGTQGRVGQHCARDGR
ncbi:hypothetical protein [Paenarthrobacter sp. YJN-5]|uniref:hypothetical protein n=1 Tax=Paenarthrobacter sp. YJN-5 TaxID=2735316 RepID=UPI001877978C|nr:hypothetical protein [Paenarthrobacter sp. YJN-5]QOT19720.1 hypothetical protein HMI59_24905 [Paenarthrobacter sp. YJN-5]